MVRLVQCLIILRRGFQREGAALDNVAPGSVLGPEWWGQEGDIREAEAVVGWWDR